MIPSDRVGWGLNPDLGTWKDNRYVRCAKCGFICHLDRNHRGREGSREGYGNTFVAPVTVDDTRVLVDSDGGVTSNSTASGMHWGTGYWSYDEWPARFPSGVTLENVHVDGYVIGGPDSSVDGDTGHTSNTRGCPLCGSLMYWK